MLVTFLIKNYIKYNLNICETYLKIIGNILFYLLTNLLLSIYNTLKVWVY